MVLHYYEGMQTAVNFDPKSHFRRTNVSGGRSEFLQLVEREVEAFPKAKLLQKVLNKTVTIDDYHKALISIYHQSRTSPLTFALAATSCQAHHWEIQSYLLRHADEEKTHWQWCLTDLEKTGYRGPAAPETFPTAATSAYIAFNYFVSTYMPAARLGIAMMLESLGANYGRRIAETLMGCLKLKPDQVMFAFGHGDTDVGHAADILEVLDRAELTENEWTYLAYAASTAGILYRQIYEEIG